MLHCMDGAARDRSECMESLPSNVLGRCASTSALLLAPKILMIESIGANGMSISIGPFEVATCNSKCPPVWFREGEYSFETERMDLG